MAPPVFDVDVLQGDVARKAKADAADVHPGLQLFLQVILHFHGQKALNGWREDQQKNQYDEQENGQKDFQEDPTGTSRPGPFSHFSFYFFLHVCLLRRGIIYPHKDYSP